MSPQPCRYRPIPDIDSPERREVCTEISCSGFREGMIVEEASWVGGIYIHHPAGAVDNNCSVISGRIRQTRLRKIPDLQTIIYPSHCEDSDDER